jgi:UDP-N-acetylmuramyl pentapeptide phosphotransferase/UDP-N-acetylglucosamine-1-phosphate transferase
MTSVVDIPAVLLGLIVAAVITAVLLWAHRADNHRRGWIAAGVIVLVLGALGALDVARESPRETNFTTPLIAALVATLAALGMVRATHRANLWLRAPIVFVTALIMLFGGLLFAASYVAKILPV